MSDRGVSVSLERRRPLIAVLLAPSRPALAYVDFGAFLEGRQSDLDLCGFRFLARRPLLLHDVDAGCAAITFDAQTRCIASKPRILERYVLDRA